MSDKEYYLKAEQEHTSGNIDAAILAKARTLASGDEEAVKVKYIQLRVEELKQQKMKDVAKEGRPIVLKLGLLFIVLYFISAFISTVFDIPWSSFPFSSDFWG